MKKGSAKQNPLIEKIKNIGLKILYDFVVFLSFLFNLPVLLSLGLAILLFYLASRTDIENLKLFYSITASALTGVLGGLVTNHMAELTNNRFALKKSISAIRNLQLIKHKVSNLLSRVADLKTEENMRDFDEIENLANNLNKDIINSISDWGDINPASSAIVDNFETKNEKEQEIKQLKKDNQELSKNLDDISTNNKAEKKRLEDAIKEKEKKISELQEDVFGINRSNIGLTSGTPLTLSGLNQLSNDQFLTDTENSLDMSSDNHLDLTLQRTKNGIFPNISDDNEKDK